MKVRLRTFKYSGTLKREFPSVEDAQKFVELMANKFPDMIFEPYIEQGDNGKNKPTESRPENLTQTVKKSCESFEECLWNLFENEE